MPEREGKTEEMSPLDLCTVEVEVAVVATERIMRMVARVDVLGPLVGRASFGIMEVRFCSHGAHVWCLLLDGITRLPGTMVCLLSMNGGTQKC